MSKSDYNNTFGFWAEFKNREAEKKFIKNEFDKQKEFLKYYSFLFGTIFFLFYLADFFIIEKPIHIIVALFLRILVFLCMSSFVLLINRNVRQITYHKLLNLYKIITIISFIIIFSFYGKSSMTVQSFEVIIIILGFNMFTNSYKNKTILNVSFFMVFILFSIIILNVSFPEVLMNFAHLVLIIAFLTTYEGRIQLYKRQMFAREFDLKTSLDFDNLTGAFSKQKFEHEVDKILKRVSLRNQNVHMVIFDLDDFKKINDTYGHNMGDIILKSVATIVKDQLRSSDIFARWGGEEFAIIFENMTDTTVNFVVERIKSAIFENDFGINSKISCSFGIASYKKSDSFGTMFIRADELMYLAKQNGKNKVESDFEKSEV